MCVFGRIANVMVVVQKKAKLMQNKSYAYSLDIPKVGLYLKPKIHKKIEMLCL
jgi:hypothetical protein